MRNFEFEHEGEKLWYSRSLAIALYLFTRDADGEMYVLANKRGSGCEYNKGVWNVPGGFIDFDETALECAERECFEETGVKVNLTDVMKPNYVMSSLYELDTKPHGRQTMVAVYTALAPFEYVKNQKLTSEHSEEEEVEDVRWINVKDVTLYKWSYMQLKKICQILKYYERLR